MAWNLPHADGMCRTCYLSLTVTAQQTRCSVFDAESSPARMLVLLCCSPSTAWSAMMVRMHTTGKAEG